MSKLLFLPDRNGREKESEGAGLVRLSADTSEMAALAKRMVIRQETDEITPDAAYQGAMALALLLDSWQGTDVRLAVRTIDAQKSRFAAWVMAARPMEQRNQPIRLLMLVKDQREALLGLVDAENGLTLAAQMGDIWDMLPERATWVNREDKCFGSPLPLLNEVDCDLLLRRLHRMNLPGDRAKSFRAALNQRLTQEREMLSHSEEETLARLAIRAQAALGMMKVPGFAVLEENSLMDTENPLMQCFTAETVGVSEALKRQQVLLWHGKAFGRSSKVLGWTDTNWPDEAETLNGVEQEIALMADGSVWWNKKLADALNAYLRERSDKALLPAAREYLTLVKGQAEQNARQVQGTVTLQFPWRADSGAVQSLLQEALGDGWQEAAKQPFSQRLTCLTGVQLGDQALRTCCILENATMLPPLSMEMAKTIAENPTALALDAFRYQVEEDGSVTASYLLRARGEVRFVRTYAPDEQLYLENPPMVAVYPCAPMAFWHQYQVLVKGGDAKVYALSDGQWQGVENRENWTALLTAQYPSCLTLEKDGESLGALPNILDKEPDAGGNQPAIASIDLGTAVTAVTLTIGGREIPATHRPLLRMLLTLSDTPMDDMMTSLTMAANLIPTAVVLTGAGDVPGRDGYVYRPADMAALAAKEENRLLTGFKWRSDAAGVRARTLLIQQLMLDTALSAVLQGAGSLSWRIAMEDDMGDGGRRAVLDAAESGAAAATIASGLAPVPGTERVSWTPETAALGAYLRGEGGIHGGCAALDIGAGSIRAAIYLQNRTTPERSANIPYGTQLTLYETYANHPERIEYDFGGCSMGSLSLAKDALTAAFSVASDTQAHVGKTCMMLNQLLTENAAPLAMHLNARANAGQVTFLQSVAAEYLAGALFAAGLLTADVQADSMQNHYLPASLPVALTGGGALLVNLLPSGMVGNLNQFVSVATGRTYAAGNIQVQLMREGKWALSRGLSALKTLEIPPETPDLTRHQSFSEQMLHLMQTLCTVCPAHMWLLHPGLFDSMGRMTPAGIDTVRRVSARTFGEDDDMPASVMQFLSELRRSPIVADQLTPPGN